VRLQRESDTILLFAMNYMKSSGAINNREIEVELTNIYGNAAIHGHN
jgi:hypothetical protein